MLKKTIFTAAHLIFWAVFLALSLEVGFAVSQGWEFFWSAYPVYLLQVVWALVGVYGSYFYLSGWILNRRKPYRYLVYSVICTPLISFVFYLIIFWLGPEVRPFMNPRLLLGSTLATFIFIQMGTLLRAFVRWYNEQELQSEREKANLQNELAVLRSQVNPHFLFNTLNNIDALVHHNPTQASQAIIMLSDMMRYLLYDTNEEFVSLEQEKECLDHLVALHRLRHASEHEIRYSVALDVKNRQIVPLLLLPIAENAFKFASKDGKRPLVEINFSSKPTGLEFRCYNSYNPHRRSRQRGGLGLTIVRKRLAAYYPGKHQLIIEDKNKVYSVKLSIQYDH